MPEANDNAPGGAQSPVLVEVTRGTMVESRHRVAFAVCDSEGRVKRSAGNIDRPVYARSSIKPLQALALVETGAAEAFDLGDAEVALACASHSGEPRHVETVLAWLKRIGCGVDDLECGPQEPERREHLRELYLSGDEATAAYNNCSGKHSGFLSVARHLGHPTKGYIDYEHPVQQRILGILEAMTGLDLGAAPRGVDGCGIPVIGVPLGNTALAMARLADPRDQPEDRQAACARIRRAMAAEPFMVAGTGRFCTAVMSALKGKALLKTGAEGFYCGALPELGLGIALKVEDGNGRAASVAMGSILRQLGVIDDEDAATLAQSLAPPVLNRARREVGRIRPAAAAPF